MIEAVLKLLGEQAVATVINKMSGRLSLAVEESAEHLVGSVQQVESKVEQQLLTSLRAGVTFLRLGERELAVAEFVRAEAADKAAAAPCIWLGVALALTGREKEAGNFMLRGLTLNPHILHCMGIAEGSHRPRQVEGDPVVESDGAVNVASIRKHPELRPWWRPAWTVSTKHCAILAASAAGGSPIINCQLGHIYSAHDDYRFLRERPFRVLAAFDGILQQRWVKRSFDRLLFSSAALVYTVSKDKDRYRLLDANTGRVVRDVTLEYFNLACCPNFDFLSTLPAYLASSCKFMTPREALRATRGNDLPKKPFEAQRHQSLEIIEHATLRPETGSRAWAVTTCWKHLDVGEPPAGQAHCEVVAESMLAPL